MKWALAAASVVLIAGLSVLLTHNAGSVSGPKATVEAAGNPSLYRVGELIEAGKVIQSNSAVGLLLALEDGSHVEMHSQSELKLESAGDGIRVRLNDGSILVTAAKQGAGHLYVQTRDAMVSVVGTVFLVTAEQSGTTVAVVEGEVHVQQGTESKKLLPGDQMATNPLRQLNTVAEEISWSRRATEFMALLQQPAEIEPQRSSPTVAAQAAAAPEVKDDNIGVSPTVPLSNGRLPFKVQANYVRVTSEQVRTLITIQFTNRDLAFRDEGGGKKAEALIQGVIYRIDNRRLPGFSQDVTLEFPSNTWAANLDQPTLYQESRYLTPGKYKLHITVEDKNAQSIGVQDIALNVPRIPDQELQASSMILAYSIADRPPQMLGTDMFALGEKRVKPNPGGVFRTNENLNVWQEIYGLTVDPASRKPSATFEMRISQNNQEIRKLTSNSTEPSYTNSVPLGNFASGPYDVQLKVTDNLSKVSLVTVGKFTVAGSSVQSAPPQNNAGKQIFDRTCTTCHNADIAMRMESRGVPLSNLDRELLSRRRSERAALLYRGLTDKHPDVVHLQSLIDELESREVGVAGNYRSYVSRHLAGTGVTLTPEEISTLSQYLLDEVAKRAEPPIPSDIPLQRQ
jgi:hypothetical protein